jgi:uncharacterized protein (TIGR02145 family)
MIEPAGKDQIFIRKLSDKILQNLSDENFGVKELAKESGMSQYVLSQRLYSVTGKTINQFIRETRLNKALEMLQNEEVTASEVAYKVGFSSPTYFNTCFHEFFGYPPGKVKKQVFGNNQEINSVQVTAKQEQKRHVWRTLMIFSSGILSVIILLYLVFNFFIKNSTYNPGVSLKNRWNSLINKEEGNNTIKDIDGNVYHTVTIGTQIWMAEDLRTTKYNDGALIPYVTDNKEWNSHTAAYCYYDNDKKNKDKYGILYNWFPTATAKLCPVSWHVSTLNDWETLINYCGGWEKAGGKLKETDTIHWKAPNVGATNETGFTAIGAGGRSHDGTFSNLRISSTWWCPPRCGDIITLSNDRTWVYVIESYAEEGYCVRCVKDKQ